MVPEKVAKKPDAPQGVVRTAFDSGEGDNKLPFQKLSFSSHAPWSQSHHWVPAQASLPPLTVLDSSCVLQRFCKHVAELETKKQHLSKK